MEPEVLVPLSVYRDVKQVVLIGDVQQGEPRVGSQLARQMGLGQPLMKAFLATASHLNIQYRMVGVY